MISLLGDYNYTFPKPIPLKLKLKDMLEDNVSEKYYLSDKMINCFLSENKDSKFPRKERFLQTFNVTNDKVIATLNTGGETKILENKSLQKTLEQNNVDDICYIDTYNKKIDKNKSGTITTRVNASNNVFLAVKNNNKKGYLEAHEGDGVDISSRMEYHRGTVQKDKIQTLDTMGGESKGVVVLGNYTPSNHNASRVVDNEGLAPTVMENHGTVTATNVSDLRIRKLTPKECFRLMGVKDEDFEKVKKNQSDSSLYHLAGDSIVVNVLMAIFKEML